MSAKDRLQSMHAALSERGVQDVKFFISKGAETPHTTVVTNVAEVLEAMVAGKHEPLPKFGDSVRSAHQQKVI